MRFPAQVPPPASRGVMGAAADSGKPRIFTVVHGKGPKRRIPADSNFFFHSLFSLYVFFSYLGLMLADVLSIRSFWGETGGFVSANNYTPLGIVS
ncbi:hypothetical protein ACQKWADRAFT_93263 [Trichoderma austrokoningii]